MALKAVIFDRDGVLNVDAGYTHKPEDLEWTPGAISAIRRLNDRGVLVLVATNQAGLARGYYDEDAVALFHDEMQAALKKFGAHIDKFYICPFHADAIIDRFRHPNHPDRKPNPGMLLAAMEEWALDPAEVVMVGDRDTDMEAARRAGVEGRLYRDGDLSSVLGDLV